MQGNIDTSFQTMQRDLFESGLVAEIGANAFASWLAIKNHADYNTGIAYPSVKRLMELTGLASATVQKAIKTLEEFKLLRRKKVGKRVFYVARERLDLKFGKLVICTIVVDYVPVKMRKTLDGLKNIESVEDLQFFEVEIIPAVGFEWTGSSLVKRFEGSLLELPIGAAAGGDETQERVLKLLKKMVESKQ